RELAPNLPAAPRPATARRRYGREREVRATRGRGKKASLAFPSQLQVETEVGAGGDVLVVELELPGEGIRELVREQPSVPARREPFQHAQVELVGEQVRAEARHRLETVRRHREIGGEVDVRIAQDGVLGDEPAHLFGETGHLAQRLDADRQSRIRRTEGRLLQVLRDEPKSQQKAQVGLGERRFGGERDVRLGGSAEGVQAYLVLLHLRVGLEVEGGSYAGAVGEGEDALLDLELVSAEERRPVDR